MATNTRSRGNSDLAQAEIDIQTQALREKDLRLRAEAEARQQERATSETKLIERVNAMIESACDRVRDESREQARNNTANDNASLLAQIKLLVDNSTATLRKEFSEQLIERENAARLDRASPTTVSTVPIGNLISTRSPDRPFHREANNPPQILETLIENEQEIPPETIPDRRRRVRDALEVIPRYDGRTMTLERFAKFCRQAQRTVPVCLEKDLADGIIQRLTGRALACIDEDECQTVNEILDQIAVGLGCAKTLFDYYAELGAMRMRYNEDVLDYVMRVRDIHCALLDCERREGTSEGDCQTRVDKRVITALIKGLTPNLRGLLRIEQLATAKEAYKAVKALAQDCRLDREMYGTGTTRRNDPRDTPAPPRDRPTWQSLPKPLQMGNSNREYQPRRDNGPAQQKGYIDHRAPDKQLKYCNYCRINGHEWSECRRRIRDAQSRQANNETFRGNNSSGNAAAPANRTGPSRAVQILQETRPVNQVARDPPQPSSCIPSTSAPTSLQSN